MTSLPHCRLLFRIGRVRQSRVAPVADRVSQFASVFLVLALRLHPLAAQSPRLGNETPSSLEFAVERWRTDNGLPQNTITSLLQTRRGYIWAGTYSGLVQFDGLRFKVFDSSNTKGLANSRVTSLLEDSRGEIWIGHDNGEVSRFADDEFAPVPLKAVWGHAMIKDFTEDEDGDIWALNQLGEAFRVKDGLIIKPPPLMAEYTFANPRVTVDARRRVFVNRNGVVARLTPGGYQPVDFSDPARRPYYAGIASSRDGQLWVAGEGSVRKWNGTNWTADIGALPRANVSIEAMLETSSGRLLVGTLQDGLFVHDPTAGWSVLNRANGLPQDWVCSLTEDTERNLWVGTGGGLALLRERKVTMLNPPDDWQGRPVYSITRAQDGNVWAATEGGGVYRFDGTSWTNFGNAEGLANLFVWSVFEDSQQQLWAGTWGGGLFRFEHGSFVSQTNLIPASDPVVAMVESPAGTMWIGTGAGLVRIRSNVVERLAHFGGAAAGDVRAVQVGANGEIWVGTQGSGLGRLKDGIFQSFRKEDGLADNFILSLLCETNGTLWIGTLDLGVCRYRDGKFQSINVARGLPGNAIYHIEDDQLGNLWFNSPTGIFRVNKRELNECADGNIASVQVLAFGKAEGLATLAGTGGFTPSGFRAPDGRFWFPTARGVAVIAPWSARRNTVRPPVWVEEVLVDGLPAPIRRRASLPELNRPSRSSHDLAARGLVVLQPGLRQLDVQFTGLSYTSPERVQFRYRLEGLDTGWAEAGTRRRVTYPFLPPGEYTFRVLACNSDGLWSENSDTLAIIVLPHFWQMWWFKTGLVILGFALVGGSVYLGVRQRHRRKLERIGRERELERERARIAQDIHDDLGASLTRIGMLSQSAREDLADPPRAANSLAQIYETARDLTRAMDEIVWAVNPRHDTLDSLVNYVTRFAHDFLSAAHIRCRLDAPMQLPELTVRSEVRHNLFLTFKETLNNAVKHSGASEVRVTLEVGPRELKLIVGDNGSGIGSGKVLTGGAGDRVVSGYGINGIRDRMEQIGGTVKISSQAGQGTQVALSVPLR